jgi:pimeloyl-ACP methyl ester carboxylesterase
MNGRLDRWRLLCTITIFISEMVKSATQKEDLRPPGQLIDVGGRRLHAVIQGKETGKLPVVFEAGLTAMSSCWAWVQEELSKHTKTLSYDRAGLGWSEPCGKSKDARTIADDLRTLLDSAQFPKPFVFVGHSMGGIFGRAYAAMFPGDIAGMVLVDASHPEQIERSPNIKWALRRFFWFLKATPYMASCGLMKVVGDFGMSAQAAGLPSVQKLVAKEFFSSPQHMRATVREAEEWFISTSQVKDLHLGDLPLITLSAPVNCMDGWMDLQKELAAISHRGEHIVVEGASHITILTNREHARRVAQAALKLAEA